MTKIRTKTKSLIFIILGYTAFILGFIGIFLPVLPTTPFMILALWAFSKGSPKLHNWLLNHPKFGNGLKAWERDKIIPLKAKFTALICIIISAVYLLFFSPIATYALVMALTSMVCALIYIFSRPSK